MLPLTEHIRVIIIVLFLLPATAVSAQIDSSYIRKFEQDFAVRVYFGTKLTGFDIGNNDYKERHSYRTNTPTAIGIGIAWKDWSTSFSHSFSGLRDKKKGRTESLDFRHHGYRRKFVYDIALQQHKGLYRQNDDNSDVYNLYPDIQINMYDGALMWIFNNKRFSYKASFSQNELQMKSTGSFHLGTSVHYSRIRTDSSELFAGMKKNYENLQFGVSGGYAHSWIFENGWFITASASLGLNLGNNYPKRLFKEKIEIYPLLNNRVAAGYNYKSWIFSFSSYYNRTYLFFDKKNDVSINMNDVNLQLSITRRFDWGNKFVNSTLQKTKSKLDQFGL